MDIVINARISSPDAALASEAARKRASERESDAARLRQAEKMAKVAGGLVSAAGTGMVAKGDPRKAVVGGGLIAAGGAIAAGGDLIGMAADNAEREAALEREAAEKAEAVEKAAAERAAADRAAAEKAAAEKAAAEKAEAERIEAEKAEAQRKAKAQQARDEREMREAFRPERGERYGGRVDAFDRERADRISRTC